MGLLEQADFGVLKEKSTWQAFGIALLMFVAISFAALSMFDSMDELFQSDAEPAPIPNLVYESLNRTGIESNVTNETGWFNLDDRRGSIIILDLMAHDCSNCHYVQDHLEENMDEWQAIAEENNTNLEIYGYGGWYSESLDYLNETSGKYTVPLYPTGFGSSQAAILEDGTTTDPVRLFTTGGTGPAPRDVSPEATEAICDRILPGFGEQMRNISLKYVPTAILSRQIAGIRGKCLIINLPGSPRSIREILDELFSAVPYCVDLIGGPYITTHPEVINSFRPAHARRE